jgi:hypothetical protein
MTTNILTATYFFYQTSIDKQGMITFWQHLQKLAIMFVIFAKTILTIIGHISTGLKNKTLCLAS